MITLGIGQLAKQTGVPIDTIRHYERIGLLRQADWHSPTRCPRYKRDHRVRCAGQRGSPAVSWIPTVDQPRRNRNALPTTETDERLMASAAIIGESSTPNQG